MKKLLPLILSIIFCGTIQAQITADFSTSSPTSGCGLVVADFLDQSTSNGNIINWTWDFDVSGNGTVNIQNPENVYFATVGSYTICLTVEDDLNQMDTECKTDFITVTNGTFPTAQITPNSFSINCTITAVTLDGSASSPSGNLTYQWVSVNGSGFQGSTNSSVATVVQPGVYTLFVWDNTTGCGDFQSVQIDLDATAPIADAGPDQFLGCTNSAVILDGSQSDTGPNIIYEWQYQGSGIPIGTDITLSVTESGIYELIVVNIESGCINLSTVEVFDDGTSPPAFSTTAETCSSNSLGTFDLTTLENTINGGTGNVVNWYIDQNLTNPIVNPSGFNSASTSVYAEVSDGSCNAIVEISLTVLISTPTLVPPPPISCTNNSITLDAGLSFIPNTTYAWTTTDGLILFGSEDNTNAIIGSSGTYNLVVSSPTCGTATGQVTVDADPAFPIVNLQSGGPLLCDAPIQLDGTGSSPLSGFTYEWRKGNYVIGNDVTSILVDAAGVYTLELANASMPWCKLSKDIEVFSAGTGPNINLPVTLINDTIVNCQEVITYSSDLIDAACTSCTVEIKDANDSLICNSLPCVYDLADYINVGYFPQYPFSISVTENACTNSAILPNPPSIGLFISTSVTDESCGGTADGSIDLSVSGTASPYTFDWLDLPGTFDPLDRDNLSAGTYTLVITDAVGCVDPPKTFEIESTPNADVSATQTVDTVSCSDPAFGPYILDGSNSSTGPNLKYEWFDANNSLVGNNIIETVNLTGFYTLVVTDTVTLCSNSDTLTLITVENLDAPDVTVSSPNSVLDCNNTNVTLIGSSTTNNVTYEWTDNNGMPLGVGDTVYVTNVGVFNLVITDITNGCTSSDEILVTENITPPIADAGPDMVLTCVTPSVILDGSGSSSGPNFTYTWFGQNILNSNTLNPEVLEAGTYTLIVTNTQNGCTASDEVIVTEDITIPTYISSPSQITCENDFVQIDAACGNCSILVTDLSGVDQCQAISPCLIQPTNGPFIITVTDNNTGCQSIDTLTILIPNPIDLGATITHVDCYSESTGMIDLSPSGGGGFYIFQWSPIVSNSSSVTNLSAGTYSVTVTDANGCTAEDSYTVNESDEIIISDVAITNASCNGGNDGAIDITVEGGTAPYLFDWNTAANTPDISNLGVGNYSVTITDSLNCIIASPDYEILENICVIIDAPVDTTICIGGSVQASVTAQGAGPFTYQWTPTTGIDDPTISNPTFSPIETTTYSLVITDGLGQQLFSNTVLTINVQNYLDFDLLDFSNAPLCDGDTLELYANLGTTFVWTGPNGFVSNLENPTVNDVTELESGIYSLTITDNFGCTAMTDIDVFIDDDCVWPGDTDTNMVVNHFDLLNIGLAFDSTGTIREDASFFWIAQPSEDWPQSTPSTGVNFKHADTDGNGIVNALDTNAITLNFGQVHNFSSSENYNQFTNVPSGSDGSITSPFYVDPDTLIEGETISLDIILGDVSNVVTGLYGIGFSIQYDSSIVVPGSATIDFSSSWLGDINADAISVQFDFPTPGRIDAAITRIDGTEMDGFGVFGNFIITLEDDILLWDPNQPNFSGSSELTADFTITDYHLINFSQEEILVNGETTTSPVEGTTSLSKIELNNLVEIYPNPADDIFYIKTENLKIEAIKIYSVTGERKILSKISNSILEFSTENLASGIYFVEIITAEGRVVKKLSIID